MLGSIIGAGMKVAGAVAGGISASKAARQANKILSQQKKDNEDWYNRRYNEDPTQRASAQRMITQVNESIKNRNQQAAGTQAVMGGTDESLAATKEANNLALADTMSQIAASGDARKDAIEQQYMANKDAITQQQLGVIQNKAQGIAGAVQGTSDAGGGIASMF